MKNLIEFSQYYRDIIIPMKAKTTQKIEYDIESSSNITIYYKGKLRARVEKESFSLIDFSKLEKELLYAELTDNFLWEEDYTIIQNYCTADGITPPLLPDYLRGSLYLKPIRSFKGLNNDNIKVEEFKLIKEQGEYSLILVNESETDEEREAALCDSIKEYFDINFPLLTHVE
jgi:hypothetical protein